MNKSHLTAISRKELSAPSRYLKEKGLLVGKLLDYGCGKGKDADILGATKYDPHFFPDMDALYSNLDTIQFDTIYCNFVFNVVEDAAERIVVLKNLCNHLKSGGTCYITVRRDKKKLKGKTSKGTWQGYIEFDLPVVYEKKGNFIIYKLTK